MIWFRWVKLGIIAIKCYTARVGPVVRCLSSISLQVVFMLAHLPAANINFLL